MRYAAAATLLISFAVSIGASPVAEAAEAPLIRTIDVSFVDGVPIGVAYDFSDATLWLTTYVQSYETYIVHITTDGALIGSFRGPVAARAIRGIAVPPSRSTIFVVADSPTEQRVYEYAKDGQQIQSVAIGSTEIGASQGIALDSLFNRYLITDFDGGELFEVSSSGAVVVSQVLPFTPGNLALERTERYLYFAPMGGPTWPVPVSVLDRDTSTWLEIAVVPRDTSIGLGLRAGLAVSDIEMFVMDTGWRHIQVFDLPGEFRVTDTVADPPTISTVAGDGCINAVEASQGVTISGTAERRASVITTLSDVSKVTAADLTLAWSTEYSAAELAGMPEGNLILTAFQKDLAGNMSQLTTVDICKDTVAPPAPSISPVTRDNVVKPQERAKGLTVTGKVAGSTVVSVTVGQYSKTAEGSKKGTWSVSLSRTEAAQLPIGDVRVTATTSDAAGNSAQAISYFKNL